MAATVDPKTVLVDNLALIDRITGAIARRQGLSQDEQDDFTSAVREKLIQNDYAVLRKFSGRSSLSTFLTVVVANAYRDYCIARRGRWRPSNAAQRFGRVGVLLDRLLHRDGYSVREAIERLRTTEENLPSDAQLTRLAARIPARSRPAISSRDDLDAVASDAATDADVLRAELESLRRRVEQAVSNALSALPPEDQMIVRLHFWESMTVADIARVLHLEQKPLYGRLRAGLSRLRADLERQGIDASTVGLFLSDEAME